MIIIWYYIRMNQNLLDKASKLKEEINNLPEVKELERLEKLLSENEEVMKLCYKKDLCAANYEDSLRHFGDNSEETLRVQKALHQAKLELDNNELVKQYNEQYKKVREIYSKINEEIFNPFN